MGTTQDVYETLTGGYQNFDHSLIEIDLQNYNIINDSTRRSPQTDILHMYIYIYIQIHIYAYIVIHIYTHIIINIFDYTCMIIYIYIQLFIYI